MTAGTEQDEAAAGRPFDIVHNYHINDQLFPTPEERALATENGRNRLLLLNWKPATDMTWRDVADGRADNRIDREATYLKSSFPYPFFLTVWHEPENDVDPAAGSGMTAADYAAMFRHVVHRLRLDGASRFVSVMNYMGYVPWAQQPWFAQLWPGDDAVDWVGIDPYASGDSTGYMSGDFNTLVNRQGTDFPGYYRWITSAHSGFPIIVAEWGVSESASNPTGKARFFQSVAAEIASYPAIRALVYFDTPAPPQHNIGDTRPDSSAISLEAWRALGMGSAFIGPEVRYGLGSLAPSG